MKKTCLLFSLLFLLAEVSFAQQTTVNATALKSGCRIISTPPSYYTSDIHTQKIDAWTVQALLDESKTLGWCSSKNHTAPAVFVLELPEEYTLTKLMFHNECQREYKGICTKDVKLEVSSQGPDKGYSDAGTFTLAEYTTSEFSVHTPDARWLRLTILSNYGNREYTELMDFKAYGTYSHPDYDASNIIGMWDSNFDWVSINHNDHGYIYGCYKWADGTLYAGTVERRVFFFKWYQKADDLTGWATVVINKEGTRLSGIWGYQENYSSFGFWDFEKKSTTPYQCWNSKEVSEKKPGYTLWSPPPTTNTIKTTITLVDSETGKPVEGKVTILEKATVKSAGTTVNGIYHFQKEKGNSFQLKAEANGYMPYNEMNTQAGNDFVVKLNRLETGRSVVMQNIHFEQGKYDLLSESNSELDKMVTMMDQYPSMEIELAGHTDNQGDADKNVELSENRVKTVKNYLIKKGIHAGRIKGVGYGGSKPIASNAQEETRKLNRRVEFKILKM